MLALSRSEWSGLVGEGTLVGDVADEPIFTAPNMITLSGYAAGLYWLSGGHPGWALWSIVADELDGESARNLGLSTTLGDRLDSGVDMVMSGCLALVTGMWWLAPATLLAQVWLKEHQGWKPVVGSARAAQTLWLLSRG